MSRLRILTQVDWESIKWVDTLEMLKKKKRTVRNQQRDTSKQKEYSWIFEEVQPGGRWKRRKKCVFWTYEGSPFGFKSTSTETRLQKTTSSRETKGWGVWEGPNNPCPQGIRF